MVDPTLIAVFALKVPVAILSAVRLLIYAELNAVIETEEVKSEASESCPL
mgnify:CR=1 FL=1